VVRHHDVNQPTPGAFTLGPPGFTGLIFVIGLIELGSKRNKSYRKRLLVQQGSKIRLEQMKPGFPSGGPGFYCIIARMVTLKKYKKTQRLINRAYHEAGHGAACFLMGIVPENITIEYPKDLPRINSLDKFQGELARQMAGNWNDKELGFGGYLIPFHDFVFESEPEMLMERAEKIARVYLAGEVAKNIHTQTDLSYIDNFDHCNRQALECIQIFIKTKEGAEGHQKKLRQETREMLSRPEIWAGVEALANELVSTITLPWKDAKRIIAERKRIRSYIALLRQEGNSDYGVDFPDFPGCVTAGKTLAKAKDMAQEALQGHIDNMAEDQDISGPSSFESVMGDACNKEAVAFLVEVCLSK